jgi:hypothetical protein
VKRSCGSGAGNNRSWQTICLSAWAIAYSVEIGESYQFRVYVFTQSGAPPFYEYYQNVGPVEMIGNGHKNGE